MPTYIYKAVTRTGLIVRNKVESASRQNLIKTIKNKYKINHILKNPEYYNIRTKLTKNLKPGKRFIRKNYEKFDTIRKKCYNERVVSKGGTK